MNLNEFLEMNDNKEVLNEGISLFKKGQKLKLYAKALKKKAGKKAGLEIKTFVEDIDQLADDLLALEQQYQNSKTKEEKEELKSLYKDIQAKNSVIIKKLKKQSVIKFFKGLGIAIALAGITYFVQDVIRGKYIQELRGDSQDLDNINTAIKQQKEIIGELPDKKRWFEYINPKNWGDGIKGEIADNNLEDLEGQASAKEAEMDDTKKDLAKAGAIGGSAVIAGDAMKKIANKFKKKGIAKMVGKKK